MFAGQAPSPAQLALARQYARLNLRNFAVVAGILRLTPFALDYLYALWR